MTSIEELHQIYQKSKDEYLKNGHEGKWLALGPGGKELALGMDHEVVYESARKQVGDDYPIYLTRVMSKPRLCLLLGNYNPRPKEEQK